MAFAQLTGTGGPAAGTGADAGSFGGADSWSGAAGTSGGPLPGSGTAGGTFGDAAGPADGKGEEAGAAFPTAGTASAGLGGAGFEGVADPSGRTGGVGAAGFGAWDSARGEGPFYGLTVWGPGLVPYVDPAFRVGAGPVEIQVQPLSSLPRGKALAGGGTWRCWGPWVFRRERCPTGSRSRSISDFGCERDRL